MNLENELRNALRRQDPPEGFADRVIRRAPPAAAEFPKSAPRKKGWAWPAAAAATIVLTLTASIQYRHIQQKRAAEDAVQALQFVAEELTVAQNEVLNK